MQLAINFNLFKDFQYLKGLYDVICSQKSRSQLKPFSQKVSVFLSSQRKKSFKYNVNYYSLSVLKKRHWKFFPICEKESSISEVLEIQFTTLVDLGTLNSFVNQQFGAQLTTMLDDDLLDVYNVLGASNSSLEEETFEPKHKSLFK